MATKFMKVRVSDRVPESGVECNTISGRLRPGDELEVPAEVAAALRLVRNPVTGAEEGFLEIIGPAPDRKALHHKAMKEKREKEIKDQETAEKEAEAKRKKLATETAGIAGGAVPKESGSGTAGRE